MTVKAIQNALSKALEWNNKLITGASPPSMTDLAKKNGVTQQYIAQLLKLAWLAPDIMQVITMGEIPSGLSLGRLKAGFPLGWEEQRKTLGFK